MENVTKYFDQLKVKSLLGRERCRVMALDNVSFTLGRGEFVAYAGPNGAGKSTTFKLLCGMLSPQRGNVSVLGLDPVKQRIPLMRQTGVLFGNRSELWWDHPVRASFEWKKAVWDIPEAQYRRMFAMVCDLLGLDEWLDSFARELSLGQRMRANLGLMLLHEPRLILLDEPTLGMDVLAKRQMIAFLKRMNQEEGVTILVTSHDMDDLMEMAQRIMLIHRGSIAFDGNLDQLMAVTGDRRILRLAMDGDAPTLPGASLVGQELGRYLYDFDAGSVSIAGLMGQLAQIPGVRDIETSRAPIESVIAGLYAHWADKGPAM